MFTVKRKLPDNTTLNSSMYTGPSTLNQLSYIPGPFTCNGWVMNALLYFFNRYSFTMVDFVSKSLWFSPDWCSCCQQYLVVRRGARHACKYIFTNCCLEDWRDWMCNSAATVQASFTARVEEGTLLGSAHKKPFLHISEPTIHSPLH